MEETWKLYCEKQRKMRGEVNQLNKIAVSTPATTLPSSCGVLWPTTTTTTCIRYCSSDSNNTQYRPGRELALAAASVHLVHVVMNDDTMMCNDLFIINLPLVCKKNKKQIGIEERLIMSVCVRERGIGYLR